jgi:hypothetical protein
MTYPAVYGSSQAPRERSWETLRHQGPVFRRRSNSPQKNVARRPAVVLPIPESLKWYTFLRLDSTEA